MYMSRNIHYYFTHIIPISYRNVILHWNPIRDTVSSHWLRDCGEQM